MCVFLLVLLVVIIERVRVVTAFFLHASKNHQDPCASVACDLVRDQSSVVVATLQYLSYLASGRAPRLRLVIKPCEDMQAFKARDQERAFVVFACARAVSGSVKRRLDKPRRALPLSFVAVADKRVAAPTRRALWATTLKKPPCCKGQFLDVFLAGAAECDFDSPAWAGTLEEKVLFCYALCPECLDVKYFILCWRQSRAFIVHSVT